MKAYSLPRRSGETLLRDAAAHAKQERDGRDLLVVDIAEIVARKMYREAGYSTPLSYCMDELQLTEKAARHRIHVARKAWQFPAILVALMERRLNLTAVSVLAAHLTEENVEELVAVAEGKTNEEIRQLVRERFPGRDLFSAAMAPGQPLFVAPDEEASECRPLVTALSEMETASQLRPGGVASMAQSEAASTRPPNGVLAGPPVPMPPERFPLKASLGEVIDRALTELIRKLEKQKFAHTDKPRTSRTRNTSNGRYVPAELKRAVAERDGRLCTFIADNGKRCPARSRLEFDHILETARGGRSTIENVRLRCRAHNQYTAERTFGAEFMERRRRESYRDRAAGLSP